MRVVGSLAWTGDDGDEMAGLRGEGCRSTQKTLAPWEAKAILMAAPRPEEEPVTMAMRFWRRPSGGGIADWLDIFSRV